MNRVIIVIGFLLVSTAGYSQTTGFLGKHFLLSTSMGLSLDNYSAYGGYNNGFLSENHHIRFNNHLSIDFTYALSPSLSAGFGYTKTQTRGAIEKEIVEDSLYDMYELSGHINFNQSIQFLYIEWYRKHAFSIIDNYFRLGFALTQLKNTSYHHEQIVLGNRVSPSADFSFENIEVFAVNQNISVWGLYYECGNRIPISEHFLLNYGIRGFMFFSNNNNTIPVTGTYHSLINDSSSDYIESIAKKRVQRSNLIGFHLGACYSF